jgi:Omp85 superfamily domain
MWTARSWIVVLLLLAAFTPVSAQSQEQNQNQQATESRAALLAAERDQKQAELTPPQRSKVERALYRYDNGAGALPFVLQSWHGFQLASGSFPAGAGVSFGTRFMSDLGRVRPAADPDRPDRVQLDTVAAYSTRGYSRVSAGLTLYRVGGAPLDVRVHGQHYEYPQEDFFGFGQNSDEGNRTNYLQRSTEGGADLVWKPVPLIEVAGGAAYLNPRIGSGTDSRFPSTDQLFQPSTIPGYQQQSNFLRGDASIALDWRDNPLHPHAGGRYGVQVSDYHDRDLDAFGFRKVTIDLQQYVPIPDRYRTIALHAAATFTDPRTGQEVPFYFEPTLGGAQALRGFREFRFRDRNSMLLTAEYRWEAWWALDGAVFVDAGQVANRRQDFRLSDFDVSYGVGFRVHSNSAFVARLDLAFSREGFIPLLRFEHAF